MTIGFPTISAAWRVLSRPRKGRQLSILRTSRSQRVRADIGIGIDCGFEIEGEWELKRDAAEWAFMRIQPMMLQASVLSRRVYWEVGGLPEQLRTREDTLLFFKLGLLYPACAVSGCGTVMTSERQHPADASV